MLLQRCSFDNKPKDSLGIYIYKDVTHTADMGRCYNFKGNILIARALLGLKPFRIFVCQYYTKKIEIISKKNT